MSKRLFDKINTPRAHALHPTASKRTRSECPLEEHRLHLGQQIADKVCCLTSSPSVNTVCFVVHKLITEFNIDSEFNIKDYFETIDDFTKWLQEIDHVKSQFKTLKPAFQKYLSELGLIQVKKQRSFLDSRDVTESHRKLICLLSNSDEQKIQTSWYNITKIADFTDEENLRTCNSIDIYTKLGTVAKSILKKTSYSMTTICKRLIELNIGVPKDALISGVQPVALLTESQSKLEKNYVEIMRSASKDAELASHHSHNVFIHLLVNNQNIQSETDIANYGFKDLHVKGHDVNTSFVFTIRNAYRFACGMDPIEKTTDVLVEEKNIKRATVSSLGRFKSTQGVISQPSIGTDGYVVVRINTKLYRIHRVIAFAFNLPRNDDQNQVNHKDGNPGNNWLINLEWVNQSENIKHSYLTNVNRKSCGEKNSKCVEGKKIDDDIWIQYNSIQDASKKLNLYHANISNCINDKHGMKHTGGYEFRFVQEDILEGEEWKEIHGIWVSNIGRHKNKYGVISNRTPRDNGYSYVGTGSKGKNTFKTYLLHRLVAEAFIPKPSELHIEVNHKDRDPSNNHVSNLEWVTKAENIRHSFETNKNRTSNATKMSKPLRGRKKDTEMWTLYPSSMEAARILNLPQGNIASCARGERKIVKGYEFEWAEGDEPLLLEGEEWREVDNRVLALLNGSD